MKVSPNKREKKDFYKRKNEKKGKKLKEENGIISSFSRYTHSLCSIRFIFAVLLCGGLMFLGGIFLILNTILQSVSIRSMILKQNMVSQEFLHREATNWLSQGKRVIDFYEQYLLTHEEELASNGWLDNSEFGEFQKEVAQIWQFFSSSQYNSYCSGFGTPSGSLFLGCQGFIEWTNATLKDNPCCNYTDDNQPSPIVYINLDDDLNVEPISLWEPKTSPYDFRLLSGGWYSVGADSNNYGYNWANFVNTHGKVASTLTKKWYDSNGNFRGVLGSWYLLENFQNQLDSLQEEIQGTVWIIDKKNGFMIASNVGANIVISSEDDNSITRENTRVKPEESENVVIAAVSKYLKEKYTFENLPDTKGDMIGISTPGGFKMVSIEVANVTGFELAFITSHGFESVYFSLFLNIFISIGVGVLVIILFCCVSLIILLRLFGPLTSLMKEMKKIETMELDQVNIKISFLSEIRTLQSSFLYSIKKLKEFKSFIPANVLKHSQHSSHTSKSIDSNSDVGSNNSGSVHSYNSPSTEKKEVTEERFGVHLNENIQSLLVIYMDFDEIFIKRKKQVVLSFISSVFDEVSVICNNFGSLVEYGMEKIILKFQSPSTQANMSIRLRKFFKKIMKTTPGVVKRNGKLNLSIKMILHRGQFISGFVGSENLKKSILIGKELQQIDYIYETIKNIEGIDIFFTKEIDHFLDEEYIRLPIDFVMGKNKKIYQIFHLVSIGKIKQDEWMYELQSQDHNARFDDLIDAFDYLLANKFEEAEFAITSFINSYPNEIKQNEMGTILKKIEEKIKFFYREAKNKRITFSDFAKSKSGSLLLKS